ncbi:MAG: 5-oxoprolinase subunit PxpA [Clostridia bacterium]|nr:5-oxoprolinase subunit PxpA [Clostridia bacterium]
MKMIDLNCDLGESFGAYKMGCDEEAIPLISSANIACGFHAGDPVVMAKTVKMAADAGIQIGAHPGFPDLMGFGRRNMAVTPAEAKAYVQYQVGALQAFAAANGMKLQHVKPHGNLYNMAGKDYALAKAICEAIASVSGDLIILALAGSEMIRAAEEVGIRAAQEVFADRAYEEDGALVARSKPGAMITDEDEAAKRVLRMVQEGKVTAITGKDISIKADSVCVHGDSPKTLAFIRKLREEMAANGISISPLTQIL